MKILYEKTKLLNIVMIMVITASLLAGCRTSAENQTISSNTVNTETVDTAASESATGTISASEQTDGVVKTTAGLVQGTDHDGIYTYLGVPYAEARLDALQTFRHIRLSISLELLPIATMARGWLSFTLPTIAIS